MVRRWPLWAACTAALIWSSSATALVMEDYNLVVLNNLNSSSEVEGQTIIGGNINGTASNYGIHLTSLEADTLVVGGDINATVNLNAGQATIGGSINGTVNANNGSTIDMNPTAAQAIIAAAAAELPAWSSSLQGLGGAAISLPGSQPGPVNLNAAPDAFGVATFSVGNGSNLFNNSNVQQIDLVWNDADYVVVNVGGTSIQWNHGNMVGGLTTEYARSHVIWNFFEATSIRLEGRGFNGALLAPNAWLRVDGVVEGSVFVKSFRQEGEVHLPTFAAADFPLPPAPIPEPGTFFLVVAGLALMRPLGHRSVSRAS